MIIRYGYLEWILGDLGIKNEKLNYIMTVKLLFVRPFKQVSICFWNILINLNLTFNCLKRGGGDKSRSIVLKHIFGLLKVSIWRIFISQLLFFDNINWNSTFRYQFTDEKLYYRIMTNFLYFNAGCYSSEYYRILCKLFWSCFTLR